MGSIALVWLAVDIVSLVTIGILAINAPLIEDEDECVVQFCARRRDVHAAFPMHPQQEQRRPR